MMRILNPSKNPIPIIDFTVEQIDKIKSAIVFEKPIIIVGPHALTGKTYLKNWLNDSGIKAYEAEDICIVELTKIISIGGK